MKTKCEKDATYLAERLREHAPEADVEVHAPSGKGTIWWIDATRRGHTVTIEWSREDGFGISTPTEDDYGSAANEVYVGADEAVDPSGPAPHERREGATSKRDAPSNAAKLSSIDSGGEGDYRRNQVRADVREPTRAAGYQARATIGEIKCGLGPLARGGGSGDRGRVLG